MSGTPDFLRGQPFPVEFAPGPQRCFAWSTGASDARPLCSGCSAPWSTGASDTPGACSGSPSSWSTRQGPHARVGHSGCPVRAHLLGLWSPRAPGYSPSQ
jgi:hypothetical protein